MSLSMRLVAYAPNGARQGLLPTPQTVQAAMPFGDVGGIEVAYPAVGPKASLLASPCEIAVEVSYDDGQTWSEPDNARYLRLVRKGDTVDDTPVVTYSGPAYLWTLSKAKVLPEGLLNADGKRPFLSATAGTILKTLIQEAQARGALTGLDASSFTGVIDSNGAAWSQVITLYYEPGLDYLTILMNLQAQGLIDFTMTGRALKVYNGDTVMAGASGATLRKGRDLTEAPYAGTLEGLASFAYLQGDDGYSFQRTNATALAPWGRWEAYISQGGVKDTGTMTVLTDTLLDLSSGERVENTYGLLFASARHLPFRDYGLGQTIQVADGTALPVALRCRQITLTRDEKGVVAGNVVLNDRFLENDVRQNRRIQGITGGATADGGSGARPAPTGSDLMPPKAPTIGSYTNAAYLDDEGKVWALTTVNVNPVTQNADGTAIDDLGGYELFWRIQGTATWSAPILDDDGSGIAVSGLFPNTAYEYKARAFDSNGNHSADSPVVTIGTADDTTAPGKPAAPTVTPYLGQLLLSWSGLLTGGAPLPDDFARAEFHLSTSAAFATYTVVDTATAKGPASTVATGLVYGTTYYARMKVYDRSGNGSVVSDSATGVPVKAATGDIVSITADQITAGVVSAAITISGRIATSLTGARVEINATGLKAYDSGGVNTVSIGSDGSALITGTYQTSPSGRRMEISAANALANWWGADGQHSVKWYPSLLSSGWTPAGILPITDTAGTYNGAGLFLQSSQQTGSGYAGSSLLLAMNSTQLLWTQPDTARQVSIGMYASGSTIGIGMASSADWVEIGNGGTGYETRLYGATTLYSGPNNGYVRIYDRDNGIAFTTSKDTTAFVQSATIYNRTYTGTANVIITGSGVLGRISSLEATKVAIDRTWADSARLDAIKGLTPASYYDRWNAERYALLADNPEDEEAAQDAEYPRMLLGLIAEDVEALGLEELVTRDGDGALAGVAYDRLAVALIPWLRDLEGRLNALEATQTPVNSPA